MEPSSLTPEQKAKIKKAKIILWLGLGVIMLAGLIIVFYFVFVRTAVAPTVNGNVNIAANTNSVVDTSDWETHANARYGFQFKYPSDWQLEEFNETCPTTNTNGSGICGADIVTLSFQNSYYLYFTYQGENPKELPITAWLKQVKGLPQDFFDYELKYDKEKGVSIAGLEPGIYQGAVSLYFQNNNQVFGIEWFDNDKKNDQAFQVFNKILLSFEFTETVDTSDWLTYENSKYKYSVKVPKGWTVNTTGLCDDNRVGFGSEPFDCSPDGYSGTYSIIINTGDQSLAEIKTKSPNMNFVETTIGGQPALQYLYQFNSEYLGGEFTRTGYMVIYQGNTYTIGEELQGKQTGPTDGLINFAQTLKIL
jgi:hypothetical protein